MNLAIKFEFLKLADVNGKSETSHPSSNPATVAVGHKWPVLFRT